MRFEPEPMLLTKLRIENFRKFESFELELDPRLTVLVGDNGSGKTAVLEAASVALGGYLSAIPVGTNRHIAKEEVFQHVFEYEGALSLESQFPVQIEAWGQLAAGEFGDGPLTWERTLRSPSGRTTQSPEWKRIGKEFTKAVRNGATVLLPLIAHYGTQRVWKPKRATEAKRGVGSRFDGYLDALDPASNHRLLAEWMYQQTLVELQQGKPVKQMAAVERAVCRCISGATRFLFNVRTQSLEVHYTDGSVDPFAMLSDGYRNMVAMTADIAWRASVLNPHFGENSAVETTGVVLIDEVDLHLHPTWQRHVLSDLKSAFPRLQFIVTTHSPQVVAEASRNEIRLLLGRSTQQPYVQGRDSNSLLLDVFGVEERPPEARERLDALARLIHDENFDQARRELDALRVQMGPEDTSLLRAQWELELEEGC